MMKLQDVETETEKSRNESGVAGQVDHMKSLFSTISKISGKCYLKAVKFG